MIDPQDMRDVAGPLDFVGRLVFGSMDRAAVKRARREQKQLQREQRAYQREQNLRQAEQDRRQRQQDHRIEWEHAKNQGRWLRMRFTGSHYMDPYEKELHRASVGACMIALAGYLGYLLSAAFNGHFISGFAGDLTSSFKNSTAADPQFWIPAFIILVLLGVGLNWFVIGIARTQRNSLDARLVSRALVRLAFGAVILWASWRYLPSWQALGYVPAAMLLLTATVKLGLLFRPQPSRTPKHPGKT